MPSNNLVRCPRCDGSGQQRGHIYTRQCVVCRGSGKVPADSPAFD